jgi:choline dehydrogenase-like flavoprotein
MLRWNKQANSPLNSSARVAASPLGVSLEACQTAQEPSAGELGIGLDRRSFVALVAGSVGVGLWSGQSAAAQERDRGDGGDPLGCLEGPRFATLAAFFEAQLCSLWSGTPADDAASVARDAIDFVRHLPPRFQGGICDVLAWLDFYSRVHTRRTFARLGIAERWTLLNQGENPPEFNARRTRLILWEDDFPLHAAISGLALLGRLIINSRQPAQKHIGCGWSAPCRDERNLVHLEPPAYPSLAEEYDVCVIGSGAGGAVVAARAAAAGYRVLIVEAGKWVSPDALVERETGADGRVELAPARSDRVLKELYRSAGVQMTGEVGKLAENRLKLLLPGQRRRIPPHQSMLVLQAQVVGGGPYVNNAIHLEMQEEVWNRWPAQPSGKQYAQFFQRMQQIKQQLGVNVVATKRGSGLRGLRFADGAVAAGDPAMLTPVSILEGCNGCGADNSVDPFGMHTGGLHPYRAKGPNSFLVQALSAEVPAAIAYETSAVGFEFETDSEGKIAVRQLVVEDRRGRPPGAPGERKTIRAKQYSLCAGVVASTRLLQTSLGEHGLAANGLGEGLSGNVGGAVLAVYDQPIYTGQSDRAEPGITQCFFVREREVRDPDGTVHKEPILENWFHFPGTVALALNGWFHEFGKVMRKYNHMASAGMVVPTAVRPENRIAAGGNIMLELNQDEFELLLRGMLRIGRIFLAATTPENGVTLYLPTKSVMLDDRGQPLEIRNEEQLRAAIEVIRGRGPAYLNLVTSHPQGGNCLGKVVDPATFRLQLSDGRAVQNLYLADASVFPAGCEVNPQLTLTALASFAADSMLGTDSLLVAS